MRGVRSSEGRRGGRTVESHSLAQSSTLTLLKLRMTTEQNLASIRVRNSCARGGTVLERKSTLSSKSREVRGEEGSFKVLSELILASYQKKRREQAERRRAVEELRVRRQHKKEKHSIPILECSSDDRLWFNAESSDQSGTELELELQKEKSDQQLADFSSDFSRPRNSQSFEYESAPLRCTQSAHRLQVPRERTRLRSLAQRANPGGDIEVQEYEREVSQISEDLQLLRVRQHKKRGRRFVDQEMVGVYPTYEEEYISKTYLKVVRRRVALSALDMMAFPEVRAVFSVVKRAFPAFVRNLLMEFNADISCYSLRLLSDCVPKEVKVDGMIPIRFFFEKTTHFEHWPFLIEKALIKEACGREALAGWTFEQVFNRVTGGHVQQLQLGPRKRLDSALVAQKLGKGFVVALRKAQEVIVVKSISNILSKVGQACLLTLVGDNGEIKIRAGEAACHFNSMYFLYASEDFVVSQARESVLPRMAIEVKPRTRVNGVGFLSLKCQEVSQCKVSLFVLEQAGRYRMLARRQAPRAQFQLQSSEQYLVTLQAKRRTERGMVQVKTLARTKYGLQVAGVGKDGSLGASDFYLGKGRTETPWVKCKHSARRRALPLTGQPRTFEDELLGGDHY